MCFCSFGYTPPPTQLHLRIIYYEDLQKLYQKSYQARPGRSARQGSTSEARVFDLLDAPALHYLSSATPPRQLTKQCK